LLTLQRSQVDLTRGTVRLAPGSTKNKDGWLVYLPAEALAVLREQERATRAMERAKQQLIPWVFHNDGEQLRDYDTGWRAACVRAGCPGMRPHDFRRTAARNYTRAGVVEQVAMRITGHKTRNVFDRWNITAERDLAEAASRVTSHKAATRKGRARDTGK
jgi:integrase